MLRTSIVPSSSPVNRPFRSLLSPALVAALPALALAAHVDASAPDLFGLSVTTGDFNADGFGDLAVGAPGRDNYGGGVSVYYGNAAGVDPNPELWSQDTPSISGLLEADDSFGGALAAGDFNGDGFDDLAVGVPWEDIGSTADAGAVNVIYGSCGGLSTVGQGAWDQNSPGILGASEAGDLFGWSLASGDFDDDGFADLAIGVMREDINTIVDAGLVNVLYGGVSGLSASRNQVWYQDSSDQHGDIREASEPKEHFGWSVSAGDFNDDGIDDLAVGVPGERTHSLPGHEWGGFVHMIHGSSSGLTTIGNRAESVLSSTLFAGDQFGTSLAVGDFNADGRDDLAMGMPNASISGSAIGALKVRYPYSAPGHWTTETWSQADLLPSVPHKGAFGYALVAADFDGDLASDLAVGIPGWEVNGVNSCGQIHVIYGSGTGLETAGNQEWHQDSPGILDDCEQADQAGRAIGAGDFNNDGYADLVIGVPQEDGYAGRVNIVFGSSAGLTAIGNAVLP